MTSPLSRSTALTLLFLILTFSGPAFIPFAEGAEVLRISAGDGKSFYSYSTRLDMTRGPYPLNINGGKRPYTFSITNPLVKIEPSYPGAQVSFNVMPKAVGTTILTVKDQAGNTMVREIVVYAPGTQPLTMSGLPAASNPVAVGQGRSFGISGGKPPYTVVSSNPGIARIEPKTTFYFIWGVTPGAAQITVTDASRAKVQGTAYVGDIKLLSISADSSLLTGGKGELVISSGNPPYTVTTSSNLSAALKGKDAHGRPVYMLMAKSAGQGTITVKDGKALTETRAVSVKDTVTLSFPQLTGELRTIDVGQTTTLVVAGGKPPYTVTASNPAAIAIHQQTTGQYTVTGRQAAVAGIVAKDSSGATRELSLIVRNAPTLTVAGPSAMVLGASSTLTLIGGASPFTVSASGNQLKLIKIDEKKYTLTPKSPGRVVITVKDAKGTTKEHAIDITAPVPPLKLLVSSNTLQLGATGAAAIRVLSVQGGVSPYTATVSGNQLSLTQLNATQFQMTPKARGTATITVKDSKGTTASQTITVQ
jgi:hypothetical protein